MLTIIKASLLASALMLLESCTDYLTSYQTPCVEGHVCECVRYTTINRSWLDCRDYGRKSQIKGLLAIFFRRRHQPSRPTTGKPAAITRITAGGGLRTITKH